MQKKFEQGKTEDGYRVDKLDAPFADKNQAFQIGTDKDYMALKGSGNQNQKEMMVRATFLKMRASIMMVDTDRSAGSTRSRIVGLAISANVYCV